MVQTIVIYNPNEAEQCSLAESLANALKDNKVVLRGVSSQQDMSCFLTEVTPDVCQVLIDVNLTGYENETTGGVALINRLPMDIVNVITGKCETYDHILRKNQSYMARFVFMDEEEVRKAEEMYPHLWHVSWCENLEAFARYIGCIELRYSETR